MGCCSSSDKGTEIEKLKEEDDELKALKGDHPRPASSTMMKRGDTDSPRLELATPDGSMDRTSSGKKKRGKPKSLSVGKQLRDPNMIVTTPMNDDGMAPQDQFPINSNDHIAPVSRDRHEEDLNRLAMFIPWEKPALGAKKRPKLRSKTTAGGKRKKGKKGKKGRIPGGTKKGSEQVFIPGSGNEKILLADRSKTLTASLPPLKFSKVEASSSVKRGIAADRKKAVARKKQISGINKFMKQEIGFDDKIAKLIRQYAEISNKAPGAAVEMVEKVGGNHSRTVISCPVKAPPNDQ